MAVEIGQPIRGGPRADGFPRNETVARTDRDKHDQNHASELSGTILHGKHPSHRPGLMATAFTWQSSKRGCSTNRPTV